MEIWGFICVCKCCDVRTICCPRICIDGRPLARCPSGVCTWFWGWVLWPSPCSWGTSSCRKKKKKKKKKNIIKSQKLDNKLKTAERPSEAKRPLGAWSILCIRVQFTQLLLPKQNKKKNWIIISSLYLPALVMIISVPTSSNFVQSSLSWRKTLMPSIPCSEKNTSKQETFSVSYCRIKIVM